jgi:FAD/FMN-containing dehydrogenase/Fe-S oxidoreductase
VRVEEAAPALDSEAFARSLRSRVSCEVRFDTATRALYATDASNYRHVPIGVILPRQRADVVAAVATAREFGVPVLPRGAGTGLAGQTCNVALVIDFSKYMRRLVSMDPDRNIARVEPGLVLDDLRSAAEAHALTFGPDPSTHDRCTLGGMIGNNSCGVHSVMAGLTSDNVERLTVLTYDGQILDVGPTSEAEVAKTIESGGRQGQIYRDLAALRDRYGDEVRSRFPKIKRRISGYNLDQLLPENGFQVARALVGTEGTCVTVLEATLRLVHSPPVRRLLLLGYEDVFLAARAVPSIMEHSPIGLEGFDEVLVENARLNGISPRGLSLLPAGGAWLLVEFGAETVGECDGQVADLLSRLRSHPDAPTGKLLTDSRDVAAVWAVRESGLGAAARVPGRKPSWPGWEDSAVRPDQLEDYLRDLRALLDRFGYHAPLYGHFGDACLHPRIDFDLVTPKGIQDFRRFLDEAADLCVRYGGSLSGEHGDGQARAALYPKLFGTKLVQAFGEFKDIWDPENRMNPGKVAYPRQPDQDLRLGVNYRPARVNTHFHYTQDPDGMSGAVLRCVGIGKCRRTESGTMCPSFMVTREELHSTRGRAHLLHEMLTGDLVRDGWRDEGVKQALDLCFSCKACKSECPVNVDMATYKAEFLSHYYAGRLRPPSAYAIGLFPWWARLAAWAPGVANAASRSRWIGGAGKAVLGISAQRELPVFATETFRHWFRRRPARNGDAAHRVLLWADTFNNYLRPDTARAAVAVLEAAGCEVSLLPRWHCCGRPLYDQGMLDLAKKVLRRSVREIEPYVDQGYSVVGLEPTCVAVFRDELPGLFPDDAGAREVSRSFLILSEFLERIGYEPPALQAKAMMQAHCHHKAVMKTDTEEAVLNRLGLDLEILDAGCCGMAGGFGFEKATYEVGMKAGERVLFPAIRSAPDAMVIADGFSCREQIRHATGRDALHLAEVLALALERSSSLPEPAQPTSPPA